ncbi:hypothetical protein C8R44DRAFT_746909 [Mycena epipterygia]|nr:hypothetical protein C8R44DRAFT_746909 [Mycena epipterygia]
MTSVGLVALAVRRKHNKIANYSSHKQQVVRTMLNVKRFRVSEVKGMWFSSKTEVGEVQKERKKNNELIEDIFDWLVQPARDSKSTSEASRTSTATTSSSKIDRARGTSANSCEASSVLQGIDRPLREAAPAFKGNLRRSRLRRHHRVWKVLRGTMRGISKHFTEVRPAVEFDRTRQQMGVGRNDGGERCSGQYSQESGRDDEHGVRGGKWSYPRT